MTEVVVRASMDTQLNVAINSAMGELKDDDPDQYSLNSYSAKSSLASKERAASEKRKSNYEMIQDAFEQSIAFDSESDGDSSSDKSEEHNIFSGLDVDSSLDRPTVPPSQSHGPSCSLPCILIGTRIYVVFRLFVSESHLSFLHFIMFSIFGYERYT